jgi:hypothetical protein
MKITSDLTNLTTPILILTVQMFLNGLYSGFQEHPYCDTFIIRNVGTRLKVETQLLIESVPWFIFCEVMLCIIWMFLLNFDQIKI